MNYIYSFIIFEAGAFFGFFVAALLNAARAGQEITIKFEEEDNGSNEHGSRADGEPESSKHQRRNSKSPP